MDQHQADVHQVESRIGQRIARDVMAPHFEIGLCNRGKMLGVDIGGDDASLGTDAITEPASDCSTSGADLEAQTVLFEKLQELNKQWFDRVETEATLASELAAKFTAARSIPEVATAYQVWASRHVEMATEDAKRLLAEGQRLAETGARLLSNGWWPNGLGSST